MLSLIGRHGLASVLCGAVVLSGLSACTSDRLDPRDAVESLATALTEQDLAGVRLTVPTAEAQRSLTAAVEDMGGFKPEVKVGDIDQDGDSASAGLTSTWDLAGWTWSYTTTAELAYTDDEWRVAWQPAIIAPKLTAAERLSLRTTPADRGDIRGARDEALVTERRVQRIGIDKTKINQAEVTASAKALARVLDIDVDRYVRRVEAAGPQAFVVGLVVRADADNPFSDAQVDAIPGAVRLGSEMPLTVKRGLGQPLLGTVGEATAEIVKKSKGAVRPGALAGLSGLQLRHDETLRGRPGVTVVAEAAEAKGAKQEQRMMFTRDPRAGKALRTTIDARLQGAADDILADVKPASAIVAIRPSSGHVVALASGPGADGADTAATGRYAPGSTFKLVTALAFLRSGLTPSSTVPCTPTVTVDGRRFKNYSDYPASGIGTIPLRSAIANSCNTAMIATRSKAPQADLAEAAAALGLGPDVDLGTPAFLGSVSSKAEGTERGASMIGQGRIEASPLAMAVVAASIANGARVTPTLLADSPTRPAAKAATPLTRAEAAQLREMFRAVVTEGSGRFLADVPGGPVSAKTGTAEYGKDTPPRTHAWMIATQGDLAVAVFVADGRSGSGTAGPLLERFLRSAS